MEENEQKNMALFLQLVYTFQSAAWQQLGKIKNPLTDKIEKDLYQARFSIDMLKMILAKTEGNLTDDEKRMLTKVISDLQLNFVDEFSKSEKATEHEPGSTQEKKESQEPAPKKQKTVKKKKSAKQTKKK